MKDVMAMVEESAKSFATWNGMLEPRVEKRLCYISGSCKPKTHLCYPPNVLIPVLLREAQVLIEAEADIVAVEPVRREAEMQQVLLEGRGNSRLA